MLNADQSRVWEAMGIGPQWLLRESIDPLLPESSLVAENPVANPAVNPAVNTTRPVDTRASVPVSGVTPRSSASAVRDTTPVRDVRETYRPTSPAPAPVAPLVKPVQTAPVLTLDPDIASAIPTADWAQLKALAESCRCCSMEKTRHHVVFAEGKPGVRMVLVGEAPGSEEDLQGIPFVGKSGQLLTEMLDAVNIRRGDDIAIMNVLKCRPPQNRNPAPAEIACCEKFLRRQLELMKPDVILIMGRFAFQTLLKAEPTATIGSQRGRIHTVEYADGLFAKAVVTYHPSYLLRSPDQKAKAWDDLLLLKKAVNEAGIPLQEKAKSWN